MYKQRGKIHPAAAVLIIVVALAAMGTFIVYGINQSRNTPQHFFPLRRNLAARLLNEVRDHDLINNYPETALDVILLNNNFLMLYHGQMVSDPDLLWELIGIQRHLFSDSLMTNNSHQQQFDSIWESINTRHPHNVYVNSIEVGQSFRSGRVDMYVFPITMRMVNYDNLYWNYFVYLDDSGRWRIANYDRTDSTFRNILD